VEYLITKECLRFYARDRGNKWFAEFGGSRLKPGEGGAFPYVGRRATVFLVRRAKGVHR
jgi:hypothetical protein